MIITTQLLNFLSNIRQLSLLITRYNPRPKKLVVFFINGRDEITNEEYVNGGIISILSLAKESKNILANDNKAEVVVCTNFGEKYLSKFNKVENNIEIFKFNIVHLYFGKSTETIIHIPDWRAYEFSCILASDKYFGLLNKSVHLNILNQNIRLMPSNSQLEIISNNFFRTTVTAAHDRYCNGQYRMEYRLPLHLMSVYVTKEDYHFTEFENKRKLLIYSPDDHPSKGEVLNYLRELDWLELVEIRDIPFYKYKDLISQAMFSLTFGEGLDGYFVEPIFSGAIGITVYNDDFFPVDFQNSFKTVYNDYDELCRKIVNDINNIVTDENYFKKYQQQLFSRISMIYNKEKYTNQIEKFYKYDYTYK